ncbi:Pkinase-domain-containing protein [Coprinopsis marcescibilis]|uniref:mitogen-activated protein kinase n=1 Tax=Coprinopsis marcescibilis TaxID=230819 RepID=A0A5C3KZT7_COPMA|nr:Pkinase-domain-containing protein [Coprinopsis marcescibilis]
MSRAEQSRQRSSSRGHRRRRDRGRSNGDDNKSSSPLPSPGSWPNGVDRGRSRVRRPSNPFSEDNLRLRGYHSLLSSFGKVFHVEKRWKLVREMGSGAYGVVISAADEISGETVAIKMVTRVFEKIQLAKRALREITLLRHFSNHENITGLIDVDAIVADFNEVYIFMEPMEADLHQIIKSGQILTNEHVQYFLYQILRGMKFIHSAGVIHRDLKPGNLLVNADCELKICDFGLSRGFDATNDENATRLTEYVATRWYRAPEIMLAFPRYNTAIDVWSIGCILGELMLGKPLFKGKDYVDQLNKILDILGTPDETIFQKIGSDKAQAYVRSLPFRRVVPFRRILPKSDPQALDLMGKMLTFDPETRITVPQALEHPWLAAYHDETDEPECLEKFDRWREIEQLETLEDFRKALWEEIEDYRREVRGINLEVIPHLAALSRKSASVPDSEAPTTSAGESDAPSTLETAVAGEATKGVLKTTIPKDEDHTHPLSSPEQQYRGNGQGITDPVVTYARRSSILQPSRQGSVYNSPIAHHYMPTFIEGQASTDPHASEVGTIAFPTQPGYVVPARSRTGSTVGGSEIGRRLLRTLSTVSIHETGQGRAGGLADIAPIGKYIVGGQTEADAPPSEMPRDFNIRSCTDDGSDSREDTENSAGDVEQKVGSKAPKFQVG